LPGHIKEGSRFEVRSSMLNEKANADFLRWL
jgi:hypothetical protein